MLPTLGCIHVRVQCYLPPYCQYIGEFVTGRGGGGVARERERERCFTVPVFFVQNGLWLALGWCCLFLVLLIISAALLSCQCRKTNYDELILSNSSSANEDQVIL